jgi:hypothetical protein
VTLSPNRKLAGTAALFLIALITVALAAATTSYVPLFFTVFPLIGVAWVLSRDEPDTAPAATSAPTTEASAVTDGPGDPTD